MKVSLSVLLLLNLISVCHSAESDPLSGRDYNLSMAGALISNNCEETWQNLQYVSIHACRYHLAQRYSFDVSSRDFEECVSLSGGDIVRIGECMTERFKLWLDQEEKMAP